MRDIFKEDGTLICHAKDADTIIKKIVGLAGKKSMAEDEGLFFKLNKRRPPHSVLCFFMRFPIWVLFLDQDHVIVDRVRLKPWKRYRTNKDARYFLELPGKGGKGIVVTHDLVVGTKLFIEGACRPDEQ